MNVHRYIAGFPVPVPRLQRAVRPLALIERIGRHKLKQDHASAAAAATRRRQKK